MFGTSIYDSDRTAIYGELVCRDKVAEPAQNI